VVSGYSMAEPEVFAKRIYKVISLGLEVDPDAKVPFNQMTLLRFFRLNKGLGR